MNISYLYQYLIDIAESDPRDQLPKKALSTLRLRAFFYCLK